MYEVQIQNYVDRERMVIALVNSGYTVKVVEKPDPQRYLGKMYFVQIIDNKVETHEIIKERFSQYVSRANESDVNSTERVYINGYWSGFKEAVSILNESIVIDENKLG